MNPKEKPMHEIIQESINDFKKWIAEDNFPTQEDIELAETLKSVIHNWENRKKGYISRWKPLPDKPMDKK